MKQKDLTKHTIFRTVFLIYSLALCLCFNPKAQGEETGLQSDSEQQMLFCKPLHEVASLGAPTTGSLVEGSVGSLYVGRRHRFHCHSPGLTSGFLGPQETTKPLNLKDQPGVFPAPLAGEAFITFEFYCQDASPPVVPVIIRPDGTVYQGLVMSALNSPQILVVSSPAQTGIYTLFVLAHLNDSLSSYVTVNASINTQPQNNTTFHLKSFEPNEKKPELMSAEFIYINL